MGLSPGTRLGIYEILTLLGSGGMGEVYRARDTKLNREVAIKVLPESLMTDPERLARFSREALVLAALNHPNIAHIHGFEDSTGVPALIMELVEGTTLADRIARGPISLDQVLPIAKQIAEGLEAAHEQGIIHRDLKPANIKVREDGTVKILDFGLAKALEPKLPSGLNVTQSPTITTPAMMTGVGMVLGTAAYMSPEQAKGRPVGKRTDIWAFGCVLYEMLTGIRAFGGEDVTETIAAIVRAEPDWTKLPAATPLDARKLLVRCLRKNPRERLPDIGVARLDLDEAIAEAAESALIHPTTRPSRRTVAVLACLLGVAVVTGAVGASLFAGHAPAVQRSQRLAINVPPTAAYAGPLYGAPALSRDGNRLAYVGVVGSKRMLFLRALDEVEPHAIPGTEDATSPFFSRDGQTVAFFSDAAPSAGVALARPTLKKVSTNGGIPVTICDAGFPLGGVWTSDDTIVFATGASPAPGSPASVFVVSAAGGVPRRILPDVRSGSSPEVLSDGKHILVSIATSPANNEFSIAVAPLAGGAPRTVIPSGSQARYVPAGYIIYATGTTLMAVRFDVGAMETRGEPVPLVENVDIAPRASSRQAAAYAVSDTDVLAYSAGAAVRAPERTLVWTDRRGHDSPLAAPPKGYTYPRISPDGNSIALDVRDQVNNDIWIYDLMRGALSRVTTNPAADQYPVWMPDGQRLLFASNRAGAFNVYAQAADGSGSAERLFESADPQVPLTVSPDGTRAVIRHGDPKTGDDLMLLSIARTGAPPAVTPLVKSAFVENDAEISPDGRWLAYQSNESGRFEIYVRPFPDAGAARWTVSAGGGTRPVWARNGSELFYINGTSPDPIRVMRIPVQLTPTFAAGPPELLFEGRYYADPRTAARGRTYDVSPDGTRFLMIKDDPRQLDPGATTSFNVVLNALEHLK